MNKTKLAIQGAARFIREYGKRDIPQDMDVKEFCDMMAAELISRQNMIVADVDGNWIAPYKNQEAWQ